MSREQTPTYEEIAYDSYVRRRQNTESVQLPGVEQRSDDHLFTELTGKQRSLIANSQHFFLSTITGSGWPYTQHRGGPAGFVHINDAGTQLGWAEFNGNNQFVTTGNIDRDGRVCLFFVDYPLRRRLKLFGKAHVHEPADHPELLTSLTTINGSHMRQTVARLITVDIIAVDTNCSKHIQPRWDREQVEEKLDLYRQDIAELREHIAQLEEERDALKNTT